MWHFCICSIKMPGMSLWAVLLLKHSLFSAVKPLTLVIHCAELVDLWQSMLRMNMWWKQRSCQRKANEHSPAQRTLVRLWVGGGCNIVMLMSVFDTKNVRDTREGGGETVSSHTHAEPFLVCDLQRTREHVEEDVRCPYPSLIWLRVIQASYIFGRESSQESYRCSSPFFPFCRVLHWQHPSAVIETQIWLFLTGLGMELSVIICVMNKLSILLKKLIRALRSQAATLK